MGGGLSRLMRSPEDRVRGGPDIYAMLSRPGFPRSYRGKIFFVAFACLHLPPVALVVYLLLSSPDTLEAAWRILALLACATLVGSAAALYALNSLLAPVNSTARSVREYLDSGSVPDLPVAFGDEAGRLMADVRYIVEHLDSSIRFLEGLSGTDPLTGLLNRREVEKRLAEDAARVRRHKGSLTIGVIDVNNFKSINDQHGHLAGDVCIRHVANVIRRNIRQSDWLARWGGDEFVFALYDASPFVPAELVLQRITSDLRDSPVQLPNGDKLTLTITIGASRYSNEEDLRKLLAKADEAMYEAKREGRPWILSR
jgi:diguanylate cyclase (GGDEF)-like protein